MSRRRRLRRRWPWVLVALVIIALIAADRGGLLLVPRPGDFRTYDGVRARVVWVIDGDTFDIDLPDRVARRPATRIRLWGIDCPEQAGPDQPAQPWADEARELTRALVEQGPVTLYLEPHRTRGTFGRVLAHVEGADGRSLNGALLEAGYATVDERWPHSRLSRYAALQRAAQQAGAGMWGHEGTEA
ncbi:MAG: thermonuclease family protein, partial [Planctomycetota bacterium]